MSQLHERRYYGDSSYFWDDCSCGVKDCQILIIQELREERNNLIEANSQLREQIAREILENFNGGHTKGENDCSCEEGSDPCYYCGAKDYTGIAAAIARGEK